MCPRLPCALSLSFKHVQLVAMDRNASLLNMSLEVFVELVRWEREGGRCCRAKYPGHESAD